MKLVILDLEWNTALDRKSGKTVNEIIEIGAVKLDENLNEIDRFSTLVASRLTSRLSSRFKSLTGITNEEMRSGCSFEEAAAAYAKWASGALTLTWSNSDIYALYDNYHTLLGIDRVPCIAKYADLQKYTEHILRDRGAELNNQISLSAAADMLDIDYYGLELHRAVDDCALGAMILRQVYDKELLKEYIIDTSKRDYYKRLTFKPYIISDINSPKINKRAMSFKCDSCRKKAERVSQWRFKGKSFRADFVCRKCGIAFIGCISFKSCFDSVSVRKYKVKAMSNSGYDREAVAAALSK